MRDVKSQSIPLFNVKLPQNSDRGENIRGTITRARTGYGSATL